MYLSSFGEANGGDFVSHAKIAFLSTIVSSESCMPGGSSLCLPGGWPMPLQPRDFVLYPRESSVRQNCMYVDFLACQYALQQNSVASSNIEPYPGLPGITRYNFPENTWKNCYRIITR